MRQTLVDALDKRKEEALEACKSLNSYEDLVKYLVTLGGYDPERIERIDHGDYQGTLVFVVAEKGYQPSRYWYVVTGYGSCSGCDALESACEYGESQDAEGVYQILHDLASGFRLMNGGDTPAEVE